MRNYSIKGHNNAPFSLGGIMTEQELENKYVDRLNSNATNIQVLHDLLVELSGSTFTPNLVHDATYTSANLTSFCDILNKYIDNGTGTWTHQAGVGDIMDYSNFARNFEYMIFSDDNYSFVVTWAQLAQIWINQSGGADIDIGSNAVGTYARIRDVGNIVSDSATRIFKPLRLRIYANDSE